MSCRKSENVFLLPAIRIEKAVSSTQDDPQREAELPVPKPAKVYAVPIRDEFEFEIKIKTLQTSRKQKNKLSLSRDVLETIIGRVSNLVFLRNNTNILYY